MGSSLSCCFGASYRNQDSSDSEESAGEEQESQQPRKRGILKDDEKAVQIEVKTPQASFQEDDFIVRENGKPMVQEVEIISNGGILDDVKLPDQYESLTEFQYDGDNEDYEIPLLSDRKQDFEKGIKFSKNGIMEYIDSVLSFEQSEDEKPKWQTSLDKNNIKVSIKQGGSSFNADQPYVLTEQIINSAFTINQILKAQYHEEHRQKWDKGNVLMTEIRKDSDIKSAYLMHQICKGPLNMKSRDFVDKRLMFSHKGAFYCFYSASTNQDDFPVNKNAERAESIIGIQKIYRRKADDKIVFCTLTQLDFKMQIPAKLISTFMPNGYYDWSMKFNKYLTKAHKKL